MEESYNSSGFKHFSFLSLLLLVFLLPVFFLPSSLVSLPIAKSGILALLALVSTLLLFASILGKDGLYIPKHKIIWATLILPVTYFASSLLGTNSMNSLFGYTLEVGTFLSIFLGVLLFFVTVFNATSTGKIMRLLEAFFISGGVLAVFALVKIFSGGKWLVLSIFDGNMANPVGAWTDYVMFFGILFIFSIITLVIFRTRGVLKAVLSVVAALSLFLMMVMDFSIAWWLTTIASFALLVYFALSRKMFASLDNEKRRPVSVLLVMAFVISLIFALNPTVPGKNYGVSEYFANKFNVQNINVRPGIGATLSVDKSALSKSLILGDGPNTFSDNWLMYKTKDVNSTSFWNTPFSSGVGFLPTQVASVGLLGSLAWLSSSPCLWL
jgi:hypothetical protein